MKELEYAWAAGFLDGEACITVRRVKKTNCYTLVVQVAACDIAGLEKLKKVFGLGGIYNHQGAIEKKRNASFVWLVSGPKAIQVIKLVLPYLITKLPEAEVALKMELLMQKGNKPVPQDILDQRHKIYEELRRIKGRNHLHLEL